jgi:hypothetical protein
MMGKVPSRYSPKIVIVQPIINSGARYDWDNVLVPLHLVDEANLSLGTLSVRRVPERPEDLLQSNWPVRQFVQRLPANARGRPLPTRSTPSAADGLHFVRSTPLAAAAEGSTWGDFGLRWVYLCQRRLKLNLALARLPPQAILPAVLDMIFTSSIERPGD